MSLKKELRQFSKPFTGMRRFENPSHVVIYVDRETASAHHHLCFANEVERVFNYLQPKVYMVQVFELGREVASFNEQEHVTL